MAAEALKTLFHPFGGGELPLPDKGRRVLFLGAEPGFRLPRGWTAPIHAVQPFKPSYRALQAAGLEVAPCAEGADYGAALVLAGRHRGCNEVRLAEALERTVPRGLIVVAGSREDGIASLRKRVGQLLEIDGSEPKYHGVVFWLRRPADGTAAAALREANPEMLVEGRFRAAPGMFSHDRVDRASRRLAEHLPPDLSGDAADFGAGWGYLTAEAIARCPRLRRVDLYEADFDALEAARRNVAPAAGMVSSDFFWQDILSEPIGRRYDAVIMNPPFHTGRAADPAIGQAMIGAAAGVLKPGGRLLLVANRQLPYEHTLEKAFGACSSIAQDGRFKVLEARR
jgi:16S rRNA (guanine1207-N2)-methyltransferase